MRKMVLDISSCTMTETVGLVPANHLELSDNTEHCRHERKPQSPPKRTGTLMRITLPSGPGSDPLESAATTTFRRRYAEASRASRRPSKHRELSANSCRPPKRFAPSVRAHGHSPRSLRWHEAITRFCHVCCGESRAAADSGKQGIERLSESPDNAVTQWFGHDREILSGAFSS